MRLFLIMHFEQEHIYHLYNKGNSGQRIFYNPDNYFFFLDKIKKEWLTYTDILSYCLMPNHFHFIIAPKPLACDYLVLQDRVSHLQQLSKIIGKTLSSYATAINNQNFRTGALFQKKTKAKCLTDISFVASSRSRQQDYLSRCFDYVHNNPIEACLVDDLKDWPYSSWFEYYGNIDDGFCNKELLMERIGVSQREFERSWRIHPV
jgi:putative transposase